MLVYWGDVVMLVCWGDVVMLVCWGDVVMLVCWGDVVMLFLLFIIGYQIDLSCLLSLETYFTKDSFRIS